MRANQGNGPAYGARSLGFSNRSISNRAAARTPLQLMLLFSRRTALRPWCILARRLTLLYVLLLAGMFLLHLLRLLGMALLHLLLLRVAIVFLGGLLVFPFLLLLQFLVILRLLGREFLLLLLVFLIGLLIPGVRRIESVRLHLAGVIVGIRAWHVITLGAILRPGTNFISRTWYIAAHGIWRRRFIFAARLPGSHHAAAEIPRSGRRCDRRLPMIRRSAQFGVSAGLLDVLFLRRLPSHVTLARVRLFLRVGAPLDPAIPSVVADPVFGDIHHSRVIGVVNDGGVHAIHVSVVREMIALPAASLITLAAVAESVVNAAIEAHVRAPVSFMKTKRAAFPTPISRSPQESNLGRFNPCARHPVVAILVVIRPETGRP